MFFFLYYHIDVFTTVWRTAYHGHSCTIMMTMVFYVYIVFGIIRTY